MIMRALFFLTIETPPRAWGRRLRARRRMQTTGNTPTGVGKTWPARRRWGRRSKHPHGRGEDAKLAAGRLGSLETPPRAWGRHPRPPGFRTHRGNTPTGVGKTSTLTGSFTSGQKHPHGRGEDAAPGAEEMRGAGNTPTGVGKTCRLTMWQPLNEKHPHGRGEDAAGVATVVLLEETPPRAWGRLPMGGGGGVFGGNTPTGVGKTTSTCVFPVG